MITDWKITVFLFLSTSLFSHPLDMGLLVMSETAGGVKARFEMNPGQVSGVMETKSGHLLEKALKKIAILSDGGRCEWKDEIQTVSKGPQSIGIIKECLWKESPERIILETKLWDGFPSTFHLLVKWESPQGEQLKSLDRSHPNTEFETRKDTFNFISFVRSGLAHIGVTPSQWWAEKSLRFPDGFDHILFVIALVFSGGGWVDILKMVTGFTVGHSITLALGSLGWLSISPQWIEPLIALSIAWIAAKTVFKQGSRSQWKITILLGLVHGLGFANALNEYQLRGWLLFKALLGFNCGVELGQAFIVFLICPVIYAIKARRKVENRVVPLVNLLILVVSSYWFFERVVSFSK